MTNGKVSIGDYLFYDGWLDEHGPDWCTVLDIVKCTATCKVQLESSGAIGYVKRNKLKKDPWDGEMKLEVAHEEYMRDHPSQPMEF